MTGFPRHLATRLFNSPVALLPAAAPLALQLLERSLGFAADGGAATDLGASEEWGTPSFACSERSGQDCPYDVIAGVAVIPVKGILIQRLGWLWYYGDMFGVSGYDRIRLQFMHALQNDAVDAIAFDIDSPGGEVAGCFDLADTIYNARGTKPIAAILGESAFSAAYAVASAVDPKRVWVPRTGGTGSVGVIYQHLSIADWLAKTGITPTLVTFGALKGEGSEVLELSEGAKKRLQVDVDTVGELFVDTVARNRRLSARAVAKTEAGTFLGRLGVEIGFANAVAAPDEAFRELLSQL
ncbi:MULTISPECIES: S49 family peptidase [Sphingomonas]|uniref:S49 family peptidase n=1 Tax=Sphingomonas TaxID=13687 RepID=UPI0025505D6D|nr:MULTISPECIES: S49 family peptidase [Sphingomonas]MDK8187769.1 S49 family peptidase [Sphingomonas zeae]MDK8217623.1 S49 family peptidase [Sphingomonas sp. UMB7805-LC452B]